MSSHPLGPWTFIDNAGYRMLDISQTISPQGGGYGPTTFVYSCNSTRSGYNEGYREKHIAPHYSLRSFERYALKNPMWVKYSYKALVGGVPNTTVTVDTSVGHNVFDGSQLSYSHLFGNFTSRQNAAKDIAFSRLVGVNGPVLHGLVSIGEARETVGTVHHLLRTLTGQHNKAYFACFTDLVKAGFSADRRNDVLKRSQTIRRGIEGAAKILAEHRLAYSFAIRPTIADVDNAINAVAQSVVERLPRKRERKNYKTVSSVNFVNNNVGNFTGVVATRDITVETRDFGAFGFVYQDGAFGRSVPETFGMNLGQIIPAAWELLPYSWAVDYVSNLQDFFNTAAMRRFISDFGWSLSLVESKATVTCTPTGVPGPSNYFDFRKAAGVIEHRKFYFCREPQDMDTYFPSFRVEVPTFSQAANVAALGVSRFTSSSKLNALFSDKECRLLLNISRG